MSIYLGTNIVPEWSSECRCNKDVCRRAFSKSYRNRKYNRYLTLGGRELLDVQYALRSGIVSRKAYIRSHERDQYEISVARNNAGKMRLDREVVESGDIRQVVWGWTENGGLPGDQGMYGKSNDYEEPFDLVNADFCGPMTAVTFKWVASLFKRGLTDNARVAFTVSCMNRNGVPHPLFMEMPLGKFCGESPYDSPTFRVNDYRDRTFASILLLAEAAGFKFKVQKSMFYMDRYTPMLFVMLDMNGRKRPTTKGIAAYKAWATMYQDRDEWKHMLYKIKSWMAECV